MKNRCHEFENEQGELFGVGSCREERESRMKQLYYTIKNKRNNLKVSQLFRKKQ